MVIGPNIFLVRGSIIHVFCHDMVNMSGVE